MPTNILVKTHACLYISKKCTNFSCSAIHVFEFESKRVHNSQSSCFHLQIGDRMPTDPVKGWTFSARPEIVLLFSCLPLLDSLGKIWDFAIQLFVA